MGKRKPPPEGLSHKVKEGEWIGSIARFYGFAKWEIIWNRSENKELRKARNEDPFTLGKGDVLFIPPLSENSKSAEIKAKHKFKLKIPEARLRICIHDLDNEPLKNEECNIEIYVPDSLQPIVKKNKSTDGDAMVDELIPAGATRVKLIFPKMQYAVETRLSYLEPLDLNNRKKLIRGAQQRFSSVGFDPGPIDGIDGPMTRAAVRLFQEFCKENCNSSNPRVIDAGPIDGIIGPKTRNALIKYFGR